MFLSRTAGQIPTPVAGKTGTPQTDPSDSSKEDDCEWKEFKTNQGRIFWHNSKTNKSTWDKPDELKSDLERILATSTMWREYPGGDGKTYWHNLETKQSEWEVPKEPADMIEKMNALDKEDWTGRKFDGKTQAKTVFREFLSAKGIGYMARWDDIGKILQKDPKWKIFDSYLTTGERKHALNEYVDQLQKKTREEQRIRKAAARDSLSDFLNKWRQGELGAPMQPDATFEDLKAKAHSEEWWHFLTVRDQAEAFEEAAQQAMQTILWKTPRPVVDQWVRFYTAFIGDGLEVDSTPAQVVEFSESFLPSDQLTPVHCTVLMNAWSQALRTKLNSAPEESDETRLRRDAICRKAFFTLLQDAEQEGLLNAKTEWVDFVNGPCPKKQRVDDEHLPPFSENDVRLLEKVQKRVTEWVHSDGQGGHTASVPPDTPVVEDHQSGTTSNNVQRPADDRAGRTAERSVESDNNNINVAREQDDKAVVSTEDIAPAVQEKPRRVCEDVRYLRLFLQGGSTPRELFDEFVYELWDTYGQVRAILKDSISSDSDLGKTLIAQQNAAQPDWQEFVRLLRQSAMVSPGLLEKADRAGIFVPLLSSLAKRLKKSTTTKIDSEDRRPSGASDRDRDVEDDVAAIQGEGEDEREEGQLRSRPRNDRSHGGHSQT